MAIAFDAITTNTATPSSFNHTATGSDIGIVILVAAGSDPTSITYGGNPMTKQATATVPGAGDVVNCWTLPSAPSGSQAIAITGGGATGTHCLSYTGVGAFSGAGSDTTGDPTSITFTVTAANSWVVGGGYGRNGPHALTPSTGVTNDRYGLETAAICSAGDSGAVSSNHTMNWANSASPNPNDTASVGIVLEPSSAPAGGRANFQTLLGVA